MIVNFGQALNLVGRCPSCARNLRMIFCSMTCDPHHSRFLAYNTTEEHSTPEAITNSTVVVKVLEYYISDTFVNEMYDSCKEVTNPSSNSLVMPTICGQWGEDCSPHRYEKSTLNLFENHSSYILFYRLLDFMGLGMANQGFSPFDIYFQYIPDGETVTDVVEPFAPAAVPCYEAISVTINIDFTLLIEIVMLYRFRIRVERALASIVLAVARNPSRGHLCLSRGPSVPCMASLSSC